MASALEIACRILTRFLIAALCGQSVRAAHPLIPVETREPLIVLGETFHLERTRDLQRLERAVAAAITEKRAARDHWLTQRELPRAGQPLASMSPSQLKAYFHPPEGVPLPVELRCLEQLQWGITHLLALPFGADLTEAESEIRELAAALRNARRDPVPHMDMFSVPFLAFDFLDNSIGGGAREADHLPANAKPEDARTDPPVSIFWTGDRSIEQQDLLSGFDRVELPDWSAAEWTYDGPKLSAGANPGFEVRHRTTTAKVKFRETKSEPLVARLFHALGYHTDPTDHVRGLRVRYDSRLLREFNLRRDVMMHFRLIGPPIVSRNLQQRFDPLEFVEAAMLRDGRRLSVAELRENLFVSSANAPGGSGLIDETFEARIDYLILKPVNLQSKERVWRSVGRWDYDELGHQGLRELRGAGLLAAWLGWFDCRFDNTSLRCRLDDDYEPDLRAYFSDLGAALGRSDRGFGWSPENANEFPWEFTRAPVERGSGRMRTPFRVVRFHTITSNAAFQAMTESDARWMARRIARLTREQLSAALIASGHDAAETVLYLAKLIARRDRLIQDLGLADECGLLGAGAERRSVDYDPLTDGLPEVRVGSEVFRPTVGDQVIVGGQLMPRSAALGTRLVADE